MELSRFLALGRSPALHQDLPCWGAAGTEEPEGPGLWDDQNPAMCPWDKLPQVEHHPWVGREPLLGRVGHSWAELGHQHQTQRLEWVQQEGRLLEPCSSGREDELLSAWELNWDLLSCAACSNPVGPCWVLLTAPWDGTSEGWVAPVWKGWFMVW